ncbi:MAG: sugar phosphate isomerase/epimerase family protein [Terriglobales bacterium]
MKTVSRRTALKSAGLGVAALGLGRTAGASLSLDPPPVVPADRQFGTLRVGMASYSMHKFGYPAVLAACRRLGIHQLSLKDAHLPLTSTAEEIETALQAAQAAGVTITSCGVVYLKDDDSSMQKALDYAHALHVEVMVIGVSQAMLPRLDRVVKQNTSALKLAIHNHGPHDKLFPSPLEVYQAVQGLDRRIGLCMDLGHTFRMHEDLIADLNRTRDRLYSIHFKDLESDDVKAKGVPVGTGALPIIPVLRHLVAMSYTGEVQLEYESEMDDPIPGMAESFGFMRGVLQSGSR